jgi:hypothetical protein
MAFTLSPDIIANLVRNVGGGLPGKGGGIPGMPQQPVGGLPGKGGGMVRDAMMPPIGQNFGPVASPMTGAMSGQMPNIREAMMANIGGMLGRPNFGIPQMAPRGGPMQPSAPPVGILPNPVSPAPIGNNPADRYGFRGGSIYAR